MSNAATQSAPAPIAPSFVAWTNSAADIGDPCASIDAAVAQAVLWVEAPIVVGVSICDRRRTAIVYEERPGCVVGSFRARVERVGGRTVIAYAASV